MSNWFLRQVLVGEYYCSTLMGDPELASQLQEDADYLDPMPEVDGEEEVENDDDSSVVGPLTLDSDEEVEEANAPAQELMYTVDETQYLADTFGDYTCCDKDCLSLFKQDKLSADIVRVFRMQKKERHKLLHMVLVSALRVDTEADAAKRARYHAKNGVPEGEGLPRNTKYEIKMLGQVVCRPCLMQIFNVSKNMVNAVQAEILDDKIFPTDSKAGFHCKGTLHARTTSTVEYILWYGANNGYPCPCGRGGNREKPVIYLPAAMKKIDVFNNHYNPALRANGVAPMKYSGFCAVWKSRCLHIKIRLPKTDICDTCLKLRTKRDIATMHVHLGRAKVQRDSFKAGIISSRQAESDSRVITFDYAEKVGLPRFSDTPKNVYYKTGLKLDLFGVGDNTTLLQDNYALPEGHWPADKGINSLASMLYHNHHLRHADQKNLLYMADNCPGQNKNRWMLWFMAYMSIVCPNVERVCLKFLVAGHTKNFCDACFGLCKRSIKGQDVFSPSAAQDFYRGSAKCNRVARISDVVWYDWKAFLEQFFKGVVKFITVYHEFEFRSSNPGVVYYKEYFDTPTWSEQNLFHSEVDGSAVSAEAMAASMRGTGSAMHFRPLNLFVVDPESYALENKVIERKVQKSITRMEYLQEAIVNEYFHHALESHAGLYFEVGDPSEAAAAEVDAAAAASPALDLTAGIREWLGV